MSRSFGHRGPAPYVGALAIGALMISSRCGSEEKILEAPLGAPRSPSPKENPVDSVSSDFGCQAMGILENSGLNVSGLPLMPDGSVSPHYNPLEGVRDCIEEDDEDAICISMGTYLSCFKDGGGVVQAHEGNGVARTIGAIPHDASLLYVGFPTFTQPNAWRPGPDEFLPLGSREFVASFSDPDTLRSDLAVVCDEVRVRLSEKPEGVMAGQHELVIRQLRDLVAVQDELHGDLNALGLDFVGVDTAFDFESPIDPDDYWIGYAFIEEQSGEISTLGTLGNFFWQTPIDRVDQFGVVLHAHGKAATGANFEEASLMMEALLLEEEE